MENKVIVTADKAGNVIVKSKNNEFGHIRVEQVRMVIEDNGFARQRKLSALIPGRIEDLAGFGWTANQEVDGKIIIRESLKPFNKKDPERDYKVAGKSGIICTVDEEPIYRKQFFMMRTSAEDVLIAHDNDAEIKAYYAEAKSETAEVTAEEGDQTFKL